MCVKVGTKFYLQHKGKKQLIIQNVARYRFYEWFSEIYLKLRLF